MPLVQYVHSSDAFDILTGIFFFIVFVTFLVVLYILYAETPWWSTDQRIDCTGVFLMIVCVVIGIGDTAYSFCIASQVYGRFDEF